MNWIPDVLPALALGYDSQAYLYNTATHDFLEKEKGQPVEPVYATEVRVRESCGSGAVIKVEVFDEKGGAHAIWQGNDPTKDLNYLIAKFPKTAFKTDHVKVTLATNVVPGWNEIDAVQLVGTDQP